MTENQSGPQGYENWRAARDGKLLSHAFELQLYSDAWIVNELHEGAGPYTFHNAIGASPEGIFSHAMTLRVAVHREYVVPDLSQTDTSRYHGGWLADEVSALSGLLMGVRLRSGGISRDFDGSDPLGKPRADTETPPPPLPARRRGWRIPSARGVHDIRSKLLPVLSTYPELSAIQAVTLVRAARMYQDALWVAEAEPELAWLLFVSAMEVVATQYHVETHAAREILRTSLPQLYRIMEAAGGERLVDDCAAQLARLLRATHRFLKFATDFLPPAPPRPAENTVIIPWDPDSLRVVLSKVYDYRSRALHDGIPFPRPMSDAPHLGGWYHERPSSLAAGSADGTWLAEDTPMLLHVFEYICRGTIIAWWKSVTGAAADAPPA